LDLSFFSEAGIIALKQLASMLPIGIEMFCYYCSYKNSYHRAEFVNSELIITPITNDDELAYVFELRKPRKNPYSWTKKPQLIASTEKKEIQLVLDDEKDVNTLQLRFKSDIDFNNDVLIVSFREDLGFLGIDFGRQNLNTQNKSLIAEILLRSCNAAIKNAKKDAQEFLKFSDQTKKTLDNLKNYKLKLKEFSSEHHKNILVFTKTLLSDLGNKFGCTFELTSESVELLKSYNSSLERLKSIIIKAAEFAYSLNSLSSKEELIVIEEEYFDFSISDVIELDNKENINVAQKDSNKYIDKNKRVEQYLDRLENAVKRAIANKEKVTGENVSKYMEPEVSAASITIYIKTNSDTINQILTSDITKYPQSRKYFKPLRNIIPISKLAVG